MFQGNPHNFEGCVAPPPQKRCTILVPIAATLPKQNKVAHSSPTPAWQVFPRALVVEKVTCMAGVSWHSSGGNLEDLCTPLFEPCLLIAMWQTPLPLECGCDCSDEMFCSEHLGFQASSGFQTIASTSFEWLPS